MWLSNNVDTYLLSGIFLFIMIIFFQLRCDQVDEDINQFIDGYLKTVEEHGRQLRAAVAEARRTKLQVIAHHHQELSRSLSGAEQALKFGEDLIAEGSDTEVSAAT